jgi:anti-sigma factor RsiW
MRFPGASSQFCSRAHQWISLQADGELSELERALLDAHLATCAECARFAADVETFTAGLRLSPLEQLSRPVALPSRFRSERGLRGLSVALASAAVAALAIFASFGVLDSGRSKSPKLDGPASVSGAHGYTPQFELQILRGVLQPNGVGEAHGPL